MVRRPVYYYSVTTFRIKTNLKDISRCISHLSYYSNALQKRCYISVFREEHYVYFICLRQKFSIFKSYSSLWRYFYFGPYQTAIETKISRMQQCPCFFRCDPNIHFNKDARSMLQNKIVSPNTSSYLRYKIIS